MKSPAWASPPTLICSIGAGSSSTLGVVFSLALSDEPSHSPIAALPHTFCSWTPVIPRVGIPPGWVRDCVAAYLPPVIQEAPVLHCTYGYFLDNSCMDRESLATNDSVHRTPKISWLTLACGGIALFARLHRFTCLPLALAAGRFLRLAQVLSAISTICYLSATWRNRP